MVRKVLFVVLAVMLLFGLMSFPAGAQSGVTEQEVIRKAAEEYLSTVKTPVITADELWANMNDGDESNDPFILSVRAPADYAIGHIPGAINIPYKDIAKLENLTKLPTDRQIAVYCYTGHTGQIATTVLNLLGYDAVNLKFGIMGWTEDDAVLNQTRFGPDTDQRDYPVETEANLPTATYDLPEFAITGGKDDAEIIRLAADRWLNDPNTKAVITADSVFTNLNDGDEGNDPFILSVRAPADYALGHISGAINIPWKEVAKPENLAKLPGDEAIAVYCYTGHTGQVATTILGMLGYNVSNIKYGMMGWSEDDEVLNQPRFGPSLQRDFKIEYGSAQPAATTAETVAAPAAAAPATLPTTGAPLLNLLLAGLGLTGAGLALGPVLHRKLRDAGE